MFALLALGCEEDLGLRQEVAEPFTLYGVLSPDLDTQSVYVFPQAAFPGQAHPETLDAVFTSTHVATGEQRVWRDSVVANAIGEPVHIFWSPFRAQYGERYLIEVQRQGDGAQSHAEVRIPPLVRPRLEEPPTEAFGKSFIKISFDGERLRLLRPEIDYEVQMPQIEGSSGGGPRTRLTIRRTYEGTERPFDSGWQFTFDLGSERFFVQGTYNVELHALTGIRCEMIELISMTLHAIVGDSLWDPPKGRFDANLLSHHQALDNVENGLGFVGGGYRIRERIQPSREAIEKACFY